MTATQIMAALQAAGSAATRQIYIRHGAGENQFGVKFSDLGKLAKKIRRDTNLARQLWATGNTDARMLAILIADARQMTTAEMNAWVHEIRYYGLADAFARHMASRSPDAEMLMAQWIASSAEFVAQCGWDLLASIALEDTSKPDEYFEPYLQRIEREIHQAPNRARYAMNGALIAIGVRNAKLRKIAEEAAKRIGKVHVDHGETGCKTPDALTYIRKTLEHRQQKA